jgi:SAM-dependent methyltransferase
LSERSLPVAVVVGPGGLGVAQLVSMMKFQPLLVLGQKPSRRKLRRFIGVSAIHARPGELPLQDASVELVVIAGGLGTVSPLSVGLSRLARVLKPGGVLVAITPEPSALHTKLWMASTSFLFRKKNPALEPEQITGAFLQAGLAGIAQDKFGGLLPMVITLGHATRASAIIADYFSPAALSVSQSNDESQLSVYEEPEILTV